MSDFSGKKLSSFFGSKLRPTADCALFGNCWCVFLQKNSSQNPACRSSKVFLTKTHGAIPKIRTFKFFSNPDLSSSDTNSPGTSGRCVPSVAFPDQKGGLSMTEKHQTKDL